jgi:hypothetical protein
MIFGTPPIATNGLVLHLDAGSRQSYPGSGTTWTNLSGDTSISGAFANSPTFDSTNQGSIVFNGTNQYINCGNELSQSGDWSVSGFAKLTTGGATRTVIARTSGGPNYIQNYVLTYGGYSGNNGTKMAIGTSADSYKGAIGTTTIQTGVWYYSVGTYNSTSKVLSIYVNGVLEGTATGTTLPASTGSQFVQVGCSDGTSFPFNYWNGSIAQASIYNRLLSAQEIAQNYNALKSRFGLT